MSSDAQDDDLGLAAGGGDGVDIALGSACSSTGLAAIWLMQRPFLTPFADGDLAALASPIR